MWWPLKSEILLTPKNTYFLWGLFRKHYILFGRLEVEKWPLWELHISHGNAFLCYSFATREWELLNVVAQFVVPVPLRHNGNMKLSSIYSLTLTGHCVTVQSPSTYKTYTEISLNLKFQVFWDIVPYWGVNSYWHSSSELSSSKRYKRRKNSSWSVWPWRWRCCARFQVSTTK